MDALGRRGELAGFGNGDQRTEMADLDHGVVPGFVPGFVRTRLSAVEERLGTPARPSPARQPLI
ncbi:hypothetical protein [Cupriavidus sp. H18C1]|uniref:hypothetical protein n=1 Tax=Cupriavidus sp. H18C1 TaxID=3241601 RepID=UPI003BB8AF1E